MLQFIEYLRSRAYGAVELVLVVLLASSDKSITPWTPRKLNGIFILNYCSCDRLRKSVLSELTCIIYSRLFSWRKKSGNKSKYCLVV